MAEACSVSHAENKRSLPAWMLKSCSDNRAVKTGDRNVEASESDAQTRNLDQTKPKRNSGRRVKDVDSEDAGEQGVFRRCNGRAKARKTSKNTVKDEVKEIKVVDTGRRLKTVDSEGDGQLGVLRRCGGTEKSRRMSKNVVKNEEIGEVASKNPRKVSEGAAPKVSRKRKLQDFNSESSSPETTDDEIELTVEDLVSIAEEYMNADKQKRHEQESVKAARNYDHSSCHSISSEYTTITRNTSSSEYGRDERSSHQELPCSSGFKTTGDPVQDMINIFLGPPLGKPASSVKEPEPIETFTTSRYPVLEKKDWRSEVPGQGEHVIKKKSSLKDKVDLFF